MQNYHRHSSYSNIYIADSAVMNEDYAKRAVEVGHKIISSVEHGWQGYYYQTFELAKKYNLKFVFGAEAYWVKDRFEKDKSNCHIIILAKNEKGRRAINEILSEANETGYYFRPRLDLKLLLSLPANDVFITTACVAFWKYDDVESIILKLKNHFKDNIMLEIQYHNTPQQITLNKKIKKFAYDNDIQMIVGLDSHYIYPEQADDRQNLLEANKVFYEDEEGWYMDYPDDDTIMQRFLEQGVFTRDEIQKAMDNTDICLTFDDIVLTDDIKLPTLYPNKTQEERNKIYTKLIASKLKEYIKDFPPDEKKKYITSVQQEVDVYKKTKMVDYPLIDYQIVKRAIEKGGLITDTGRGCFTKDALIHTKDNLKLISDVKIGDYVIDINGEFKKVLNTMVYHVQEDLIKINYLYGNIKTHPNICTLEHKILIHRNNENAWIQAKDIKRGDYVCLPKMNLPETHSITIDLNDYNEFGYEYDDQYIYEYSPFINNSYSYSPKEISQKFNVSKKIIEDYANGKKDDFPRKPWLLNEILKYIPFGSTEEYRQYIKNMRTIKIHRYIKLDYEFGQFIGLMYGDGCNSADRNEVMLAINRISHKDYINRKIFENIAMRFGIKTFIRSSRNKNLDQIGINSKLISNFISKLLFTSFFDKLKQFNSDLYNFPNIVKKGIINGLFLSDGSCADNRKSFDNTSLSLINAFKILCLNTENGISNICIREGGTDNRGYNRKKSYKLRFAQNPFSCNKISERCLQDEKYWYLPIKSIELLKDQNTDVYDLMIEDSHSYLINNMIVHNSGVGYFTNTLCGFSKVDRFKSPIKLYPERFISESRILETRSLPDLDLNCGNPEVFAEAQEEILGKGHAYPMIAFGTLKKKAAFKMYSRAMNMDAELANNISKQIGDYEEAYKNGDDEDKDMIDIYDYVDKKYHNYLDQSKKYWGIISDKKKAPCAYLLYQGDIRSEVGLIKCKSDTTKKEYITTVIDGAIAEKYKFLKNDLLKVDVVLLINNLYKRIGIKHHTVNELTELVKNDDKVWEIYSKGLTIGINQCEKQSTTKKVMKFKPKNISELAAFIAAIRPAFKSMYSKFETREHFEYGIKAFDNILQTPEFPQSFILYQEQTMNTLNYAGFPLDECYGIIKAIAKKHPEKVLPLKDRFIQGFKERIIADDNVNEEQATEMSQQVWQIISDSCGYGFNSAHAYCMALDSLYCAYLKSHYPYEFYEVLLQHYSDKGEKDKVMLLKQEMRSGFQIEEGKYRFGEDNRQFKADQSNHCIYPSLLSIKGLSQKVADELYKIGQNNYDTFYDIWKSLKKSSVINKGHIEILVKINYFYKFGSISKILKFLDMAQMLYERTQFDKNTISPEIENLVKKHSRETNKQYGKFDYDSALYEYWGSLKDIKGSLVQTIQYQKEYLGYIDYKNPKASEGLYYVTEMKVYKDKCKPYVTLYHLKTGTTLKTKVVFANEYANAPFKENSILNVWFDDKYKSQLVNGKWIRTDEKEKVMAHWEIMKN